MNINKKMKNKVQEHHSHCSKIVLVEHFDNVTFIILPTFARSQERSGNSKYSLSITYFFWEETLRIKLKYDRGISLNHINESVKDSKCLRFKPHTADFEIETQKLNISLNIWELML